MQIQLLVIREGGSKVEVFGKEYHFKPQPDGCHVADVEDDDHIDLLLAISEGYRIYRPKVKPEATAPKPDDNPAKPEAPFSDLSNLIVSEMSDDDLRLFATEVMGIPAKNKAPIIEWYAKAFPEGNPPEQSLSVVEMLRQCAGEIVKQEQIKAAGE